MALSSLLTRPSARRPDARTEPVAFVAQEFLRQAATIALIMVVIDVLPIGAPMPPVVRFKFVIAWSAIMAGLKWLGSRKSPGKSSIV